MSDPRDTSPGGERPSRFAVHGAIRQAMHERWCGPAPRTCGNKCEGNPDNDAVRAATVAVMALFDPPSSDENET